jgi:hypothetical protein
LSWSVRWAPPGRLGERLVRVLTTLGLVSETNLAAALSRFLSLALARSGDVPLERILPDLIEADFLIGANLETVWSAPTTDARLKKRIVRTLIHEVVADIDDTTSEIVIVVHWSGGVHSEIRLPRRRRGQRSSTSADIIAAVRELALIANDDLIAGLLNRNGLKTGYGNRWTRERVASLRSHHRIPAFKAAVDGVETWLNLSDAARILNIAPKTLRLAAESGQIKVSHPLPDSVWIFARAALASDAAKSIVERARNTVRHPAGPVSGQQSFFSSTT